MLAKISLLIMRIGTGMLLVLFRSIVLAVIGIVPNILAAGMVLGLMGLAGIPLDMMTITIAAITIGIAVDNAIHYIYRFREELPLAGGDYEKTLETCHTNIGRAVLYTSVTIIFGFSILVFSNFIPTIYFGVLTAVAMFAALIAALQGRGTLPVMVWPRVDHGAARAELAKIADACDPDDPIGRYLWDSADSISIAAALVESAGTEHFGGYSRALYGTPDDRLVARLSGTTRTAAEHLLRRTRSVAAHCAPAEADYCITAETIAERLRARADEVFGPGRVEVVVEPTMAAKAAAGANRIRLRAATCYSALDGPQLEQHELLVHTLTAVNGAAQPVLSSLGLGLPRTTRTQEGLAVFAELITGAMDVARLRRIAARVVGIAMALDGADVLEVSRAFVTHGQSEREAVQSAVRVFRGTDGRGGTAFTKDMVYLQGFVRVHDFLRRAVEADDWARVHRLFAGRLTPGDVRCVDADTDASPYNSGTNASRVTYMVGRAISEATDEVRRKVLQHARDMLEDKELFGGRRRIGHGVSRFWG